MFSSEYTCHSEVLMNAIQHVIYSNRFILGEEVKNFELEFARYVGVEHCITVANGTDALQLALKGLNIGKDDSVATVANAGFYSSTAIHAVGAKPLYVDVDTETLTMSPISLLSILNHKPKAVIVTHLYGRLANVEKLLTICNEANIPMIEDCAQSHGASLHGEQAGSFGKVACFSFYPTKNLGALGDGGAIVTNDKELADRIRKLRQYGWCEKYNVAVAHGQNSRLDEIQAAVLREKLPYLDQWNEERRGIAKQYNNAFALLPVQCPHFDDKEYVAHLYVLRVKQRELFREFLRDRGIATDVHYPIPDHLQVAYATEQQNDLTITEKISKEVITLPCFPGLSNDDVSYVIHTVQQYFNV